MDRLREKGVIANYRLTRRKLGLGTPELGEFHIIIMVRDMAQLEEAFQMVGKHGKETEGFHKEVQKNVKDMKFAIYRDFPDKF